MSGASSRLTDVDVFAGLEQDFTARRDSGALARALRGWQAKDRRLRYFENLDALIAACRDGRSSHKAVDAALSALCREAASGDEAAAVLLLWLLLPGLLLARGRLARLGVVSTEDLGSEMVAGVWEAAGRLPASAQGVASRLVNSARWRALAAVSEAIDWAGRTRAMDAQVSEREAPGAHGSLAPEADSVTGAILDGVLSAKEAVFVHADHRALVEISERLGISLAAARKRRHRARARLRSWMSGT